MYGNANLGYRILKSNTFDQIDEAALARELAVRQVTCEVPDCNNIAYTVLRKFVAAWVCKNHWDFARMSERIYKDLANTIITWFNEEMTIFAVAHMNKKYNGDAQRIVYDPERSLLEQIASTNINEKALREENKLPDGALPLPF